MSLFESAKNYMRLNRESVILLKDGYKTQIRLPVDLKDYESIKTHCACAAGASKDLIIKPPYEVGEIVYIKEAWGNYCYDNQESNSTHYTYKADYDVNARGFIYTDDGGSFYIDLPRWRSSVHMPRDAARIFLKITDICIERLQDITLDDIQKEGVAMYGSLFPDLVFEEMWEKSLPISKKSLCSWVSNPWVWVISFECILKET